jgi:ABC-type transport system involved in cytochrome bd biosynthesis fused ATPase/permease subunit
MPKISKQVPGPRIIRPATAKPSVIDRITPIGFDRGEGIKLMLYGRSGTGKTTLWGTFPKPILAVVCSGGMRPGELRPLDTPENKGHIMQVVLHESTELEELSDHAAGRYKTMVLDHVTGFQDLVLKEILGLDEVPVQRTWGMARKQDYGAMAIRAKKLLMHLLSLRINVVIIAHERGFNTGEDDESDVMSPYVAAAGTPSVTGWLNGAVDYFGQTYIRQKEMMKKMEVEPGKFVERLVKTKDVEYCLRTAPTAVFTTKFRVPRRDKPPEAIVDPTYDKVIALIEGRLK